VKGKDRRSGAQALVESLEKVGVETLFGYPGGMVVDVFDRLVNSKIAFVLGRHEQGCVHAADGYARASGKVGVVIVTSGPGLTNAVTGLGTANMDGVPLVLVSGQVPLTQIGTDAFQEADTTGITRAVSKHNFLVNAADEIPETVAEAFYIATHGKPGPVVIDLPKDVQEQLTAAQHPERVSLRAYHPECSATTAQLNRLARMINDASRPVILAGGGVIASGAAADVAALAHKAGIPVATTLMGLGSFDEGDPLSLRLAGLHGTMAAHAAIASADLILALGVRFNDRVTGRVSAFARKARIVHVDCDPSSIGKNVQVSLGIVADVKDVLTTVDARVKPAKHAAWMAEIETWRRRLALEWKPLHAGVIMPQAVIEAVGRATHGRAIVVADVGQNQMWAAQCLHHTAPRRFLTSGGMGAMGFAIPAAIGAAIAKPGTRVVTIVGDGGAQMTFEEIIVAVERRLPITVVILNNGCLGMVRQIQELFYRRNYSGVFLTSPDFVRLARAFGMSGVRVTDPARLDGAIRRAVAAGRPTLVEVVVDPEANVEPMSFR